MIVVKAGGNAIWPRGADTVDEPFMTAFVALLRHLVKDGTRVVLVPGGVGGQYLISWARRAGCSEAEMNHVGCTLIDMAALVLCRYLRRYHDSSFRVCPAVGRSHAEIELYSESFDVLLSGVSLTGAITSDSLAALLAEHLRARLIIVKSRYPYESECLETTEAGDRVISNRVLSEYITRDGIPFQAGHHASLDYVSLRVIARANLEAAILSSGDLLNWRSGESLHMLHVRP